MGKLIISLGGGGGADSSELTSLKEHVLAGKTAITNDSNDEPITGTMPNQGAKTAALNAGDSYTIPAGYHNGSGKITANSLASQTGGATAGDSNVLTGKTYWKDGVKRTGSMTDNGAKTAALNAGGSYTIPAGYHNGSGKVTANALSGQTTGTATAGRILVDYIAWVNGNKITGTMPNQGAKTSSLNAGGSYTIPAGYHNGSGKITANSLSSQTSANATAAVIRKAYTAWVNGSKITGTLAIQSALSFSAAALSHNTIRISWKNPAKGPWQGVFIQISTSSYPGTSGGTRKYTGSGNNPNQANGSNYIDITGLTYETTYYFTCTSYCDGLEWGSSHNVSAKTKEWWDTSSQASMDIWATSSKFPTVLADVDGKFKNMAFSSAGANAIAKSPYALNALSKNKKACIWMNLSPTVPSYYDTIVSSLANTTYFTKNDAYSCQTRYFLGNTSDSWDDYVIYSQYPSGRKATGNSNDTSSWLDSWSGETGVIVVNTSFEFGYTGSSWPSGGYSGVIIEIPKGQSYGSSPNVIVPMIYRSGRYWNGYTNSSGYKNYVANGLTSTFNARFHEKYDGYSEGTETVTKNVVSFGPPLLGIMWNDADKTGTCYGKFKGNLYKSK